jgi:glutamate-1-semialdehyde 2,1-aminomutase
LILKFEGAYHGHGDSFLAKAGSGVATLGIPTTPGVPPAVSELTLTVPFNDLEAVEAAFAEHGDGIAAAITEPILGNAGLIQPERGFLEGLRDVTRRHGALLIFDEVMTGFRVALGGAQARYNVDPDLTTLGKVLGGGFPVGAYGGRRDLMQRIAPRGDVYQAGTLSGNPVAMAAGYAQLIALETEDPYDAMEGRARRLVDGIVASARQRGVAATGYAVGSMWCVYLCEGPVRNFEEAGSVDREMFRHYYHACLEEGVFLPPSPFEACFLSTAHGDSDVEEALAAADRALAKATARA